MKRLVCTLLLCLLLLPRCAALDVTASQWEAIDRSSLNAAAADSGADLTLSADFSFGEAMESLAAALAAQLQDAVRSATRSAALLLVVVLFCECAQLLFWEGRDGGVSSLVGAVAVTAVAITDVSSLMTLSREAIGRITDFGAMLIPVLTATSAAAGAVTAATARQAATLFLSNLLLSLIDRVLLPFVYLYVSGCAAAAALDNGGLAKIAQLLKWAITTTLTTLLLLFTIYLSVTNFAAAGADAVAIKLTRTVISGMVPVVGGILSDASETVLSGVALIRGTVGAFGVAAVLAYCAGPFLYLSAQYLAYRLSAVLTALMSRSSAARLVEDISGAFALVMGMLGAAALLVMIAVFATLSVVIP